MFKKSKRTDQIKNGYPSKNPSKDPLDEEVIKNINRRIAEEWDRMEGKVDIWKGVDKSHFEQLEPKESTMSG